MHGRDLKTKLLNITMSISGIEQRRYLGMSKIGYCPLELYRGMIQGREIVTQDHLYCEAGYAEEQRILLKLAIVDGIKVDDLPLYPFEAFRKELDTRAAANGGWLGPSLELCDFDGRFKGHTDGSWDGELLEIKSTTAERLPYRDIPQAHFWQVQAYMRYGRFEAAKVVYVARDNRTIKVFHVPRAYAVGQRVQRKAEYILQAIDERKPPACECGRCDGVKT